MISTECDSMQIYRIVDLVEKIVHKPGVVCEVCITGGGLFAGAGVRTDDDIICNERASRQQQNCLFNTKWENFQRSSKPKIGTWLKLKQNEDLGL